MKKNIVVIAFFLLTCSLHADKTIYGSPQLTVEDPYVWLEEMDSEATQQWVSQQNDITDRYFQEAEPSKEIKEQLFKLAMIKQYGVPVRHGDRLYYMGHNEGEDRHKLYVREPNGATRVLVDPEDVAGFANAILSGFQVSPDGSVICFGLSESGSDFLNWYFIDVTTQKVYSDEIGPIKFVIPRWDPVSRGVYYVRYSDKQETDQEDSQQICYHPLHGEKDLLLYDTAGHPGLLIKNTHVIMEGTRLLVFLKDDRSKYSVCYTLDTTNGSCAPLVEPDDAQYQFVGERKGRLYFITNRDAEMSRLISLDPSSPAKELWEEIIGEREHTLMSALLLKDTIVCCYLEHCSNTLKIFDIEGLFIKDVHLPGVGTIVMPFKRLGLSGNQEENRFYFPFTDFTLPTTIFVCNALEGTPKELFRDTVKRKASDTVTKQIFFRSKDGTEIPMFITHKSKIALDKETPVLMYGYGGFNLSMTPFYTTLAAAWIEMGGVYVSVNLRGGGEYGRHWYEQGKLHRKQNVFDDFIAAAEWLIANGYTSPSKLAIHGRSNGGLLVGACVTQRPDLFGCAIPQVGVFDMLRFHKFTVGWFWKGDFGDPEDADDFSYLLKYSPYHNAKKEMTYPAMLITTADHDNRVVPLHSYKFAAALQEAQRGDQPILLRVHSNSGHQTDLSLEHTIVETMEILAFLRRELGCSF